VLLQEDLMEDVSAALEGNGVVCDKRKPGIIRVAPVPMYNTFEDVCRFMHVFEAALGPKVEEGRQAQGVGMVEARL
jgi:kynureninase